MKNTIKITAILFIAASLGLKAQNISYKILENDPDRKSLYFFLNPFNINTYFSDINIGYNVQALWLINNRLSAEVDFRKAYLDENATSVFAPKNLSKASQLQLGAIYNFSSKLKEVNNKVTLMSFSSGRYTYSRYIHVRAQARKTAGFRGGILRFHNNYKVSNDFTGTAPDKENIKAKNEQGELVNVRDSVNFETVSYTGNSMGLYGGIDLKTIRDVLIDADGYGEKSNRTINNFYLDVLFTPMVTYKIKPNAGQSYLAQADINIRDNGRKYLGWRFGWQYTINKALGFNAKMEIGQQPGRPVKTFFLNFGFGLNFGVKLKSL